MSRRIRIRVDDEQADDFAAYLQDHDLTESDAGRIAIDRLLASKPKKSEREAAKRKPGNPNFGKAKNDRP
jgi:hypothetical protein